MAKSAFRPIGRRLPHLIWLIVVLIASACTLPTGSDKGTTEAEVSGPPEVRIVSPADNATYLEGVSIPIQVSISNAGTDIDRVEFNVDGAVVATYPQPNPSGARIFSLTQPWPITAPGSHSIIVTAFRGDGTASTPAQVKVSIVDQSLQSAPSPTNTTAADAQPTTGADTQPTTRPATEQQPTAAEQQPTTPPTDEPPPTAEPTSSKPMARTLVGVNVRSGPGTFFNPPIGSLPANTDSEVLAKSPAGDWFKIVFWNGEGWVSALTVSVTGDTSGIPVDAGPNTPAPTAPPPPPATSAPTSHANLRITGVVIDPHPFVCGQSSSIQVTIINDGSEGFSEGGIIKVDDQLASNNASLASTEGIFPGLAAGQSYTAQMYLRIDANVGEQHNTNTVVDATNRVTESNENDNLSSIPHVLAKGSCP